MSKVSMVEFMCLKKPDMPSLSDFEVGKKYRGRAFNGLYQIAINWGGDTPSLMLEEREFSKYFQVVEKSGVEIAA